MLIGAFVASGCASTGTLPELEGLPGKISGQLGRRGVVVAAPHGSSDARTGEMVAEIGWSSMPRSTATTSGTR